MMREVTLKDILIIIHRTINSIDSRLLNHGEQVSYIMMNLLKAKGTYSEEEIIDLCTIAMFHDIGAYKVSEINQLVNIDSVKPFNHAVYGALFIKYFSPLPHLYKVVLGHHFSPKYLMRKDIGFIPEEAVLLGFADYIGIVHLNGKEFDRNELEKAKKTYSKEYIDFFINADKEYDFMNKLKSGCYEDELHQFLNRKVIGREEVFKYASMLAYAVDFRSESTVRHSIMVQAIAYQIGKLLGLEEDNLVRLKISGILHDIGKVAIPVEILEKPGKLTNEEFEIIKQHAIIGYDILSNLNIDDIRDIATLHHEKIDGSGYPFGLDEKKLSVEMRIMAVADILSALIGSRSYKDEFNKEKAIRIISNMASSNKIDKNITSLVIHNYDLIIREANRQSKNIMDTYINIKSEYHNILSTL